jgi:hypothetical protein
VTGRLDFTLLRPLITIMSRAAGGPMPWYLRCRGGAGLCLSMAAPGRRYGVADLRSAMAGVYHSLCPLRPARHHLLVPRPAAHWCSAAFIKWPLSPGYVPSWLRGPHRAVPWAITSCRRGVLGRGTPPPWRALAVSCADGGGLGLFGGLRRYESASIRPIVARPHAATMRRLPYSHPGSRLEVTMKRYEDGHIDRLYKTCQGPGGP